MNYIDGLILIVMVVAVIDGLRRGLVKQVIELVALLLAVLISLHYYSSLADYLVLKYHTPVLVAKPAALLGLWVVVEIGAGLLLSFASQLIPKILRESIINRVAGIIPALVKTATFLGVALAIVAAIPVAQGVRTTIDQSQLGRPLLAATAGVDRWLEGALGSSFEDIFNALTIPDEQLETFRTIQKITNLAKLRVESAKEDQMLVLVNQERTKAGLKPLVMDESLRAVARTHSRDMWVRGYFAHTNPDGDDPFARMKAAGISFEAAGENLALAPTLSIAHIGLMNSPPHKKNILEPDFGRVGIGIISAGAGGLMVTQNFRD